jgi:hypothetical protein
VNRRTFCKALVRTIIFKENLFAVATQTNPADIYIDKADYSTLLSLNKRLLAIQTTIGSLEFNLIGLDEAIIYTKKLNKIGEFTKPELTLFDNLFHRPATDYGFYGAKVFTSLTDNIQKNDVIKIPKLGQYLYGGTPIKMYKDIVDDIGEKRVILTSGVRGIVKQMQLFTSKAISLDGCLSIASRSLAPAGYSFHGTGEFDVGKIGFGEKNFTAEFAKTEEYQELIKLGFVNIRYPDKNPYGVIFEPWHIKVS